MLNLDHGREARDADSVVLNRVDGAVHMRAVPTGRRTVLGAPVALVRRVGVPLVAVACCCGIRDEVESGDHRPREVGVVRDTGVDDPDDDIRGALGRRPELRSTSAVVAGARAVPHVPLLAEERIVGDGRRRERMDTAVGSHGDHVGASLHLRGDGGRLGGSHGLGEVDNAQGGRHPAGARDIGPGTRRSHLERARRRGPGRGEDDEAEDVRILTGLLSGRGRTEDQKGARDDEGAYPASMHDRLLISTPVWLAATPDACAGYAFPGFSMATTGHATMAGGDFIP